MSPGSSLLNTGARASDLAGSWPARMAYVTHRVLQRLTGQRAALHVYLICAQPLEPSSTRLRDDPNISLVNVQPDDPLVAAFPRPAEVNAQRFTAGAECWALLHKERFAGHIWLQRDAYAEDEVRCVYWLPDVSCVWDFDVYVTPELRHGRALARLWQGVTQRLNDSGVHWTYSRISLYNPASIQAHERLGARVVDAVAFLVLGRVQIAWGRHSLGWHLSWRAQQRPVLRLSGPPSSPGRTWAR